MDDNILRIISDFLHGEETDLESAELLQWIESSDENRRFFLNVISNISLHETRTAPDIGKKTERALAKINARIDEDEEKAAKTKGGRMRRRLLGLSAGIAAAIALAVFIPKHKAQDAHTQYESYTNTTTVIKSVTLGDNTTVCLQPGTTIQYNVSDLSDKRVLSLRGEAYLDVAKDSLRPFTVQTQNIAITVLGTAFSVKTTSKDSSTEVVLERGKVRILSPDGTRLVTLSPDQKAVYDPAEGDISIEPVKAAPLLTGQYNMVTLKNADIDMIASSVEDNFGVRLVISGDNLEGKRYNFSYLRSDSLDEVIRVIEYLTGARCSTISE